MNIIYASITYFILMFTTIFTWFVLGQYLVDIIVEMVTATSSIKHVVEVGQNVITGINFTFIFFLILWTVWYAYVAHHRESEQSYIVGGQRRI